MTRPDVNIARASGPAPQLRPVPVARRVAAHLIDAVGIGGASMLLLGVVAALLGPTTELAERATSSGVSVDWSRAVLDSAALTALSGVYFAGAWATSGATLGQRLFRVNVQGWASHRSLTPRQAIVRWAVVGGPFGLVLTLALDRPLAFLVLLLLASVWTVGIIATTLRHPLRRGVHDRVSQSVVLASPADEESAS